MYFTFDRNRFEILSASHVRLLVKVTGVDSKFIVICFQESEPSQRSAAAAFHWTRLVFENTLKRVFKHIL